MSIIPKNNPPTNLVAAAKIIAAIIRRAEQEEMEKAGKKIVSKQDSINILHQTEKTCY